MSDHPETRAEARALANATPNRWVPSRAVRAWIYGILVAAGPIVTFYGLASAQEIALWLGLGGTILGSPAGTLALGNLPTGKTPTE